MRSLCAIYDVRCSFLNNLYDFCCYLTIVVDVEIEFVTLFVKKWQLQVLWHFLLLSSWQGVCRGLSITIWSVNGDNGWRTLKNYSLHSLSYSPTLITILNLKSFQGKMLHEWVSIPQPFCQCIKPAVLTPCAAENGGPA